MSAAYTRDGKVVPGEFFIHFKGVVYNTGFIDKFQIIQRDHEIIEIKAHIINEEKINKIKPKIENTIKLEMSKDIEIILTRVDDIPNMNSGKYQYVYSEVKR